MGQDMNEITMGEHLTSMGLANEYAALIIMMSPVTLDMGPVQTCTFTFMNEFIRQIIYLSGSVEWLGQNVTMINTPDHVLTALEQAPYLDVQQ